MQDAGYAHMGIGEASGKDKAIESAKAAITSPLLETTITGSKGVLISITASPDISLDDITVCSDLISSEAAEDANVIWGAAFDENLEDTMKVTIIATGFQNKNESDKTFSRRETVHPVASGRKTPDGSKQVTVNSRPAVKPQPQEKKPANDEEAPITDEDFNEILKMLNAGKNQNNNQQRY